MQVQFPQARTQLSLHPYLLSQITTEIARWHALGIILTFPQLAGSHNWYSGPGNERRNVYATLRYT